MSNVCFLFPDVRFYVQMYAFIFKCTFLCPDVRFDFQICNIARMFGKDLTKKKTNAKRKKNSIVQRFEKDLKSEKKNDKQSNIARRLGKDLKHKSGAVNKKAAPADLPGAPEAEKTRGKYTPQRNFPVFSRVNMAWETHILEKTM